MNNEALILDRLERLERAIAPVTDSANSVKELKEQLAQNKKSKPKLLAAIIVILSPIWSQLISEASNYIIALLKATF